MRLHTVFTVDEPKGVTTLPRAVQIAVNLELALTDAGGYTWI
jgi:hypothetical protein